MTFHRRYFPHPLLGSWLSRQRPSIEAPGGRSVKVRNSSSFVWSFSVALLMAMAPAPGAAVDGHTQLEQFWTEPAVPGGRHLPALLHLPALWRAGDAAVLLLSRSADRSSLRDRIIGSLLHVDAAVLELEWSTPAAEAASVEGAAAVLRRTWGAGLLIVIGLGPAEAAAALEAREPEGHGFVAQVGIAVGTPFIMRGQSSVPPEERWPERAGSFCVALTWALNAGGTPFEHGGDAGAGAYRACVAALIPGRA